eukprot:7814668-Pyramimonas_sp.AAC.1
MCQRSGRAPLHLHLTSRGCLAILLGCPPGIMASRPGRSGVRRALERAGTRGAKRGPASREAGSDKEARQG